MRGRDQFAIAWRLAAGGWVGCALLQLILYLRLSPYGGPFLLQWKTRSSSAHGGEGPEATTPSARLVTPTGLEPVFSP
ncbi:MAG: hypothetical protein QOG72_1815 [Sphingomonadales bacterium]|nr:hypothetical protein [Sphingomonadales bacterium]